MYYILYIKMYEEYVNKAYQIIIVKNNNFYKFHKK